MARAETDVPDELFIDLDRNGPIPLYFQIASRIEQAILDSTLPPGTRLENEIALGKRLGLSRPTVRRAMQELVDKGLLVRRRGVGTQVLGGPVRRKVALTSLHDDLELMQQKPTSRILLNESITAPPEVVKALGIAEGSPVVHLRRIRYANRVPVAVLENYLPGGHEFASDVLEARGLYQLLRARGITVQVAQQTIGARTASAEEAELLAVPASAPLLTMERTAFDTAGRAIEFGRHAYNPDLYSFEVTLVS